jgi:hypothetical protein
MIKTIILYENLHYLLTYDEITIDSETSIINESETNNIKITGI